MWSTSGTLPLPLPVVFCAKLLPHVQTDGLQMDLYVELRS